MGPGPGPEFPPVGYRGVPPVGGGVNPPPKPAKAPKVVAMAPGTTTPVTASVMVRGPGILATLPTPAGPSHSQAPGIAPGK